MERTSIVFDLDNTLTDYKFTDSYATSQVYQRLGLPFTDEEYEKFYKFQCEFWYFFENSHVEYDTKGLSRIDFIRSKLYVDYFKELNIPIELGLELMNIYIDNLGVKNILLPGTLDILEYLNQNYKLYIASNGPREAQIRKLTNTDILKYFRGLLTAEDCGYPKPKKEFFDSLIKRFELIPSQTVLIGDSLSSDIVGANNSNIYSIWYNRMNQINKTDIVPNMEIKDFSELKKIL